MRQKTTRANSQRLYNFSCKLNNSDGTAINCSINCIVQKHLQISGSVLIISKSKTKWRLDLYLRLKKGTQPGL